MLFHYPRALERYLFWEYMGSHSENNRMDFYYGVKRSANVDLLLHFGREQVDTFALRDGQTPNAGYPPHWRMAYFLYTDRGFVRHAQEHAVDIMRRRTQSEEPDNVDPERIHMDAIPTMDDIIGNDGDTLPSPTMRFSTESRSYSASWNDRASIDVNNEFDESTT